MGADYELVDIPSDYLDRAQEAREKMVEAIAETDDQLLEKYLSGEEVTDRGAQGWRCGGRRSPTACSR